jgi:hypothetical protein
MVAIESRRSPDRRIASLPAVRLKPAARLSLRGIRCRTQMPVFAPAQPAIRTRGTRMAHVATLMGKGRRVRDSDRCLAQIVAAWYELFV